MIWFDFIVYTKGLNTSSYNLRGSHLKYPLERENNNLTNCRNLAGSHDILLDIRIEASYIIFVQGKTIQYSSILHAVRFWQSYSIWKIMWCIHNIYTRMLKFCVFSCHKNWRFAWSNKKCLLLLSLSLSHTHTHFTKEWSDIIQVNVI